METTILLSRAPLSTDDAVRTVTAAQTVSLRPARSSTCYLGKNTLDPSCRASKKRPPDGPAAGTECLVRKNFQRQREVLSCPGVFPEGQKSKFLSTGTKETRRAEKQSNPDERPRRSRARRYACRAALGDRCVQIPSWLTGLSELAVQGMA